MPIPDFQTLMRPVLSLLSNGEEWSVETIRETLAAHFNLTNPNPYRRRERSPLTPRPGT
jgi:restriction endonuclease Mrr